MSEENVDMVRTMYEAWNEGDIDAVLGYMDAAIRIDYAGGAFPGIDERYEGHEGARRDEKASQGWTGYRLASFEATLRSRPSKDPANARLEKFSSA